MTKYYHMIIQHEHDPTGETRTEYISKKQGSHPAGWRVIGVCGYHEVPSERSNTRRCPRCGYEM